LIAIGGAPLDSINATEKSSLTITGNAGAVEASGVVNIEIESTVNNNQKVVINGHPASNLGAFLVSGFTGLSAFSDGDVNFKFTVGDAAGNVGAVTTITAKLDSTPPAATVVSAEIVDNQNAGTGVLGSTEYGPTGVLGSSEYTNNGATGIFATDDSAPTIKLNLTGVSGGSGTPELVAIYRGLSGSLSLITSGVIGNSSSLEFAQLDLSKLGQVVQGPYVFVVQVEDQAGNVGQTGEVTIELTGILGGGG